MNTWSRLTLVAACALIALASGLVAWAIQPATKAFAWQSQDAFTYLIAPDPQARSLRNLTPFSKWSAVSSQLRRDAPGDYWLYASQGTMGQRLVLPSGREFPIYTTYYASEEYTLARQMGLIAGRLPKPDEGDAVALGYLFAKKIFPDPAAALGARVSLATPGLRDAQGRPKREAVRIVGLLKPSPLQDPFFDVDAGLLRPLGPYLRDDEFAGRQTLDLIVQFKNPADASRLVPLVRAWVGKHLGPAFMVASTWSLSGSDRPAPLGPQVKARRDTLLALGLVVAFSALLATHALLLVPFMRTRRRLGIDLTLGRTRGGCLRDVTAETLPWLVLGAALGVAALGLLPSLTFEALKDRPPTGVALFALATPILAFSVLIASMIWPVVGLAPVRVIHAGLSSGQARRVLVSLAVGCGLVLLAAGGAWSVERRVNAEAQALDARYTRLWSLQSGAVVLDTRLDRAFESDLTMEAAFGEADAQALARMPTFAAAVLSEPLPRLEVRAGERSAAVLGEALPRLGVRAGGRSATVLAATAGPGYLELVGLRLARGSSGGCLVTPNLASTLKVGVGDTLQLAGLAGPVPCQVTGLLAAPTELVRWLIADLPELIAPPLAGLGLLVPGRTRTAGHSSRILVRLADGVSDRAASQVIHAWLAGKAYAASIEFIPYAPNAREQTSTLRGQARLFLVLAAAGGLLAALAVVSGLQALLDAEAQEVALDRALGWPLSYWARAHFQRFVVVGGAVGLAAVAGTALLATRLYAALALDVPGLPAAGANAVSIVALAATLTAVTLIAGVSTILGWRRASRQSLAFALRHDQ